MGLLASLGHTKPGASETQHCPGVSPAVSITVQSIHFYLFVVSFVYFAFFFFFLETGFHYVAQAGLEFVILLA
jgi:hypothetical protein